MRNSTIKPKREKECAKCGKPFLAARSFDKYCSLSCHRADQENRPEPKKRRNRIKTYTKLSKVSPKQKVLNAKYTVARKEYLSNPANQRCSVYPDRKATEVHHRMGRVGYADDWARENNIPLIIDKRFFLAVSRAGHERIENNPEWAYEMGYSERRTNK